MLFLQAKLVIDQIYTFNEFNGCGENSFVDIIIKLTITVKNYSS